MSASPPAIARKNAFMKGSNSAVLDAAASALRARGFKIAAEQLNIGAAFPFRSLPYHHS